MKTIRTLLIGIDEYPEAPLSGCVADVTKVHDYFETLTDAHQVRVIQCMLKNKEATKSGIVDEINRAVEASEPEDTFLLYYSGHGAQEISENRFLDDHNGLMEGIITHYSQDQTAGFLLADKEIRFLLNQSKPGVHIIAIFDACHSGDITRAFNSTRRARRLAERLPQRPYAEFIFSGEYKENAFKQRKFTDVCPDKNIITISACQSFEFSWEDEDGGVFTRNFLGILQSHKNIINYGDLVRNIEIAIRHRTVEKQTPTISVQGDGRFNQRTSWLRLNSDELTSNAGYISYNDSDHSAWIFSKGRLMGVKEGAQVKVVVEDNLVEFEVKSVNLNDSILIAPAESLVPLDHTRSYLVNSIDYFVKPRIYLRNIDHDKDTDSLLGKYLRTIENIECVDHWEASDFEVVIFNQTLYIAFSGDPYRPLNRQFDLLGDRDLNTFLQRRFPLDIQMLCQWHHFASLEKNSGFIHTPIRVELQVEAGKWLDITNGNHVLQSDERSEDLRWHSSYVLRVTNVTNQRLFVMPIVLFKGRLEISAYPFDEQSKVLEAGAHVMFDNYLAIDHYQEIYNWRNEEAQFKFLVSAAEDTTASLPSILQQGFDEPRTHLDEATGTKRGGGGGRSDKSVVKKWGVYTSVVALTNPSINRFTGQLRERESWYQNSELIWPFIERLYFNIEPSKIDNRVVNKPSRIRERSFKMFFGNAIDTVRRNRLFKKLRKKYPDKAVIVAEGDSWFLYPVLVKDTLDYLMENWPVKSLAWAGDTLENYKKSGQLLREVKKLSPAYVILSGGGNDIIGSQIKHLLIQNAGNVTNPRNYLNDQYDDQMQQIEKIYRYLFDALSVHDSVKKILVHGYDYIRADHAKIVTKGGWLNKYLEAAGIHDVNERTKLIQFLIDAFNDVLSKLAETYDKVEYLDVRNQIAKDEWYDEIHPNDIGYKKVAEMFHAKLIS